MDKSVNMKRLQLDKNRTSIFAIVTVASIIFVMGALICRGIWIRTSYVSKVVDKKEAAVKQLEENKAAVSELTEAYRIFSAQNPNLLGGNPDGTGDRDGTNANLILDALPSKYDFPAVVSSVEKLLSGYTINNITGQDDSTTQSETAANTPVEIPFSADVVGSYDGFKQLVTSFNKSIRPFQIVKLEISGTNNALQTRIEAKTYYQPESGVQITKTEVQ